MRRGTGGLYPKVQRAWVPELAEQSEAGQAEAVRVCPRCGSLYASGALRCGIDHELLVDQPTDPLLGRTIDRYRILEPLGTGGMGCVYRATHTIIEREYAIKVLYGDYAHDEKFRARFRREAQSVSKIRHPNVVSVEDFGTTPEGLTFLVMEFVHGRTLEQVIEQEAPLSPARTAHLVRQVAAGLGAAHQMGFVHRDVKPANVMLAIGSDGLELVKVLDFGAVSLRALPTDQRLTTVGHIIGTPTYMAPEQTQDPNVGPTADLYALGVMMHEMLTGTPPFTGAGRAEVLVKHITEPPPPTPPSKGLEILTQRLLKKLPSERIQSAIELIASIDRLNLGAPPRLRPLPPGRAPEPKNDSLYRSGPTHQVDLALVERARSDHSFDTFPSLAMDSEAGDAAWGSWGVEPLPAFPDVTPEDRGSGLRDTTDPRMSAVLPPALRPRSSTDAGGSGTMVVRNRKHQAVPVEDLALEHRDALLMEPTRPNKARPTEDDAGPTQVEFRMDPHEIGTLEPAAGPTAPIVPLHKGADSGAKKSGPERPAIGTMPPLHLDPATVLDPEAASKTVLDPREVEFVEGMSADFRDPAGTGNWNESPVLAIPADLVDESGGFDREPLGEADLDPHVLTSRPPLLDPTLSPYAATRAPDFRPPMTTVPSVWPPAAAPPRKLPKWLPWAAIAFLAGLGMVLGYALLMRWWTGT